MTNSTTSNPCHRTILIVEDDREIREAMQELLELEVYQVATACNGQEAIDLLRSTETQPRLVLLDMMMPVMDGMGFLNILTNDTILAAIPVYIHSANNDFSNVKGARIYIED